MFFVAFLFSLIVSYEAQWIKSMENPSLFEGDIVLDPDEREHRNTYASIKGGRWPGAIIPYEISPYIAQKVRANIPKAIQKYEALTCIRFKRRTSEKSYVIFSHGNGCSSPVGYRTTRTNKITLGADCYTVPVIMHEIGHSLGLYHEHSRPDRDNYIWVIDKNIKWGQNYAFRKQSYNSVDSLGTPYDYLSLMHYTGTAFGNMEMTIQTKDPYYQDKIGHAPGLSRIDKLQINKMYCKGGRPITLPPTTKPTPRKCTNDNPGCIDWAKHGSCNSNRGYMEVYCRKACKICY